MSMLNKKKKSSTKKYTLTKPNTIFAVAGEMVPGKGEDSYYYATVENNSIVAVFDGCGGIGSKRYGNYSEKTGAYVASRAVCGGVKSWFEESPRQDEALKGYIKRALKVCDAYGDKGGRLMGSLTKSFPTTAAMVCVLDGEATCYWAGDSRCYLLDEDGLHQLSEDDINGEDALSNIFDDGVLTNVICSSKDFVLHKKTISLSKPGIFLTATDGCFGYLKSPMDFEFLLTRTMLSTKNILDWQTLMHANIREFTGDEYTLQKSFSKRTAFVDQNYIKSPLPIPVKWQSYQKEYTKFMQQS